MVRSSKYDPAQAQTAPTPRSAAFSMPAPMDDTGADSVPGFAGSPRGGGATKVPRQTSAPSTQTIRAVQPSSVAPQGAPSPVHASVVLVVEVVGAMLVVEAATVVLVVERATLVLVVEAATEVLVVEGAKVVLVVAEPPAQKMSPFSSSAAASAWSARSACSAAPRHGGQCGASLALASS